MTMEVSQWTFTRDALVQALKSAPVPGTLEMLETQGGGPEDLADAIIEALDDSSRTEGTAVQRGAIPAGTYAGGGRSPIAYVLLCPSCAGYAPTTDEDYGVFLSSRCEGCGAQPRELHRFQALILSAANGGCMCTMEHRQVTGDLPTEEVAMGVLLEVRTRPDGKP